MTLNSIFGLELGIERMMEEQQKNSIQPEEKNNKQSECIPHLKEKLLEQYKLHGGPVAEQFIRELQKHAENMSNDLIIDIVNSLNETFDTTEKQKQYLKVQQDHFKQVFDAIITSRSEEIIDDINQKGIFNSEQFQKQPSDEAPKDAISKEEQQQIDKEVQELKDLQRTCYLLKEKIREVKESNQFLDEAINNDN